MSFPVVAIAIFKLSDLLPVYWPDVRSNKFPGAMNKKQFLQRYQRALLDENVLELVLVGRFRACPQHRTLSTSRWDELCWSWYTWSVKQAIQLRLKPDNMATIKKHNNGRVAKKKTDHWENKWPEQRGLRCTSHSCWKPANHSGPWCFIRFCITTQPYPLIKTSYAVKTL